MKEKIRTASSLHRRSLNNDMRIPKSRFQMSLKVKTQKEQKIK